jgi:cytochrome P450
VAERTPAALITLTRRFPFAQGPRACIGRYFSVLELQTILAVLLRRLRFGRVEGYDAVTCENFTLSTVDGALVLPATRAR